MSHLLDIIVQHYIKEEEGESWPTAKPNEATIPLTATWANSSSPIFINNNINNNNNNGANGASTTSTSSNEKSILTGVCLIAATSGAGFVLGSGCRKLNLINEHLNEMRMERKMNDDESYVVASQRMRMKHLLTKYKSNQIWSLTNMGVLFCGLGTSLFNWIGSGNGNLHWFLIASALISGGLRCGLWYSESDYRLAKLRAIANRLNALNAPPQYNPEHQQSNK